MSQAKHDENNVPSLLGVSNADGVTPVVLWADPVTHRLLVDLPVTGSTVTSVSVVTANGISGTVATATTTPAITLTLGAITPTSVNSVVLSGSSTPTLAVTGTTAVSGTNTGDNAANSSTMYIGTTQVAINRASAALVLTGITSIDGLAATATALATSRNLWGQAFTGAAGVTGSLTSVGDITGGASSMIIQAGTGVSRTLTFKTTTAGSVATTALTLAADQSATFANTVNATTFVGALTGTASGNLVSGGALGTPSSGTLTNCTGLPIAGLVASTSTALGVGSIELGHASDCTIARVGAGQISVESVTVPTISSTNTLTNKRITQRVVTTTDDATAVIDVDTTDVYQLSAVANATEFTLTGTPTDGQKLIVRLKDAGVAKGLTWTGFTAIGVTLPTTTVVSKWHYIGCTYNSAASAWHAIAVGVQA